MRLYRFFSAKYGLVSIKERRLRVGRIMELNDEFEFFGVFLSEKKERISLRSLRDKINKERGVICMSSQWSSPLMWAHYADSYKGMVLGFDVCSCDFQSVEYVVERPKLSDIGASSVKNMDNNTIKKLIMIKSDGWRYESEYRSCVDFVRSVEVDVDGNYFVPFSSRLKLQEVIVGSRYEGSRAELESIVGDKDVDVYMSRGAFQDFKVVRQWQDSMWC